MESALPWSPLEVALNGTSFNGLSLTDVGCPRAGRTLWDALVLSVDVRAERLERQRSRRRSRTRRLVLLTLLLCGATLVSQSKAWDTVRGRLRVGDPLAMPQLDRRADRPDQPAARHEGATATSAGAAAVEPARPASPLQPAEVARPAEARQVPPDGGIAGKLPAPPLTPEPPAPAQAAPALTSAAPAVSPAAPAVSPAAEAAARSALFQQLVRRAERRAGQGQTRPATGDFLAALALRPADPRALTGLAYAYLDSRRALEATAAFQQALRHRPDYPEALIGLAEACQRRGLSAPAIEAYRRYVVAHPGGPDADMARRNLQRLGGPASGD